MTSLKNAVLRQVAYAQAIRDIIRLILGRLLKGKWVEDIFASSDEEFLRKLDDALKTIDLKAATKKPYCEKIVAVLCNEVAELCETLKSVCEAMGYEDYSNAYISRDRFMRIVLSVDTVKLGRMRRIVENKELSPIELLRGIGALLDDEPIEVRYGETTRELKKSNAEILKVVKATKKTLSCVESKVEEVDRKVSRLRARRRDEDADEKEAAVVAAWNAYRNSVTASMGENTRPTYKGAFEYSRQHLVEAGVETLAEFSRIMRTVISKKSWKRGKELEARRDEARQKKESSKQVKPAREYDIISRMRKTAKNAILMGALLALFAAPAIGGSRLAVGGAPEPVRPLAEAETNVVFDAGSTAENKWRLSIELDVSLSNCVEVVFGTDADGDGVLGIAEGELCVGWDCGEWFWRDRRANELRRAAGTGRRLDWTLMLDRDRSARRLFSPSFPETVTPTCFSPEWNMARVVVRGADSVQVSSKVVVDALILRIR